MDDVALEVLLQTVVEVELDDDDGDGDDNDVVDHDASWLQEGVVVGFLHEALVRLSFPQAVAEVQVEQ